MPVINIIMTPKTPEQKERAADLVTKAVCEAFGLKAESVWLIMEEVPTDQWVIAGKQLSKR